MGIKIKFKQKNQKELDLDESHFNSTPIFNLPKTGREPADLLIRTCHIRVTRSVT